MFGMNRWQAKQNQDLGTVTYVGPSKSFKPKIELITIKDGTFESHAADPDDLTPPMEDAQSLTWVRVKGIHDVDLLLKTGERIGLDNVLLEDIADTSQRPKYQELDHHGLMVILKLIGYDQKTRKLSIEQVGLALLGDTVVTFQENRENDFDWLEQRLKKGHHLGKTDPFYLFLSLLDVVIDRYMLTMGMLGDETEELEGNLMDMRSEQTLFSIYTLKRETAFLRKYLWPLREIIQFLSHKRKSKYTTKYALDQLNELTDHSHQVLEMVDTLDLLITNMLDVYSSVSDMRMNRVMKLLTVVGTVFMPLTFITGLYGMNFENMPELKWQDGYYIVLGSMAAMAVGMLLWFKKMKWL